MTGALGGEAPAAQTQFEVPPGPNSGLALRPVVLERLSSRGMRLGVVSAPAGYGKTSHAATWAGSDGRPVAWIELHEVHNDPLVLLKDLVAAIGAVTDLDVAELPASGATADVYATVVARSLGRSLRSCRVPFRLVLDDVHRLSDVSALDLVDAVATNVPPGSAVLLVGRSCPVGAVSRLRPESCVVEIGPDDLALDAAGVAGVLDAVGVDGSQALTKTVLAETEGWPVGVRLAGLALLANRGGDPPAASVVSGRDINVSDYLESEWLWGLDDEEREFLTRVSPLEWLSGPLCNQVLGRDDAGEVLQRIFRNRLLLIPLDKRGDAYRMHGLLRDALLAELERTDLTEARRVHREASGWFERAGDADLAIRHAMAADDVDRAERLVVTHAPSLYTNGRYATIGRWIETLPEDRVAESAALCWCAALTALGLGQNEALGVWLRLGEHAIETDPEPDPISRLCLLDLRATTALGPVRPALADAEAAYQGLPPGIWHAAACLAYGGWAWTSGDAGAIEVLKEGAEEAAVLGAPALEAYCCALLAMIAHTAQDRSTAWSFVRRARQVVTEHRLERAPGMAMVNAMGALAAASGGESELAKHLWQLSRTQLAQLATVSGWANVQTRIALAHTSVLLSDRVGAETMLREAHDFLVRQPDAVQAHRQIAELDEQVRSMRHHGANGSSALTTAELRVLHYLPTHLTLAEIGERLYLSRYTVKTHCASIYRKLGVGSRTEAVEAARHMGLLAAGPLAELG